MPQQTPMAFIGRQQVGIRAELRSAPPCMGFPYSVAVAGLSMSSSTSTSLIILIQQISTLLHLDL